MCRRCEPACDIGGIAENRRAVRGNVLPEDRCGDRLESDVARDDRAIIGGHREAAVVVDAIATRAHLIASGVEEVGGHRVIGLHEKDDSAATGEVTFVKATFAFGCESRHRERDEQGNRLERSGEQMFHVGSFGLFGFEKRAK